MKYIIFLLCLGLISCGGEYKDPKEDWEIDAELCEAQDGEFQILQTTNLTTGETYTHIKCIFPCPEGNKCVPSIER